MNARSRFVVPWACMMRRRSGRLAVLVGLGLVTAVLALTILLPSAFAASGQKKGTDKTLKKIEMEHVAGEVLVKFRQEVRPEEEDDVHGQEGTEAVEKLDTIKLHRVRAKRGQTAEELMRNYANRPEVEYVEPNGIFTTMLAPNDPRISELWGLNNAGQTGGTSGADIDALRAWDRQTGSQNVVVADIDTGADYYHPDLVANMWANTGEIPNNGIDDDGNGFIDDVGGWNFVSNTNNPMDDHGHGTHTSGTIAAVGNNGVGVVGVAWQARIMPLKFLSATGSGTFSAAAQAIMYAANNGAKIASNSWGCGPSAACFSQAVEDAIAYANSKGMLFVVAAGNSNNNNDAVISYPCTSGQPNVICVAATDHNDQRATFSNYGAKTVDLGAPGVNILSTVPTTGAVCCANPTGYKLLSGTSMATPHVSGAAALLLAQSQNLTAPELKRLMMESVDPIPALAGITVSGGRLNINTALGSNFVVTGAPETQAITIGGSTTYTIRISSVSGFSDLIQLSMVSSHSSITGSFNVNAVFLPANGSAEAILTISTDAATPGGMHTLTITGRDSAGETHSGVMTVQLIVPFAVSVNPASRTIVPGGSTTYAVSVTSNMGFNTPVTLSLATADPAIQGSFSANPVTPPANGMMTSTLTVTTASSVQAGAHTISIQGTDGTITQTGSASLTVINIDLTPTAVNAPASAGVGTSIASSNTVRNQRTSAAGSFYVGLYLSPDPVITTADQRIGLRLVSGLAAGASSMGSTTVTIPTTVTPGTYYIGAIADYTGLVAEVNEANNALVGNTIVITPQNIDLTPLAVSGPTSGATGTTIGISTTVQNQGTSAAAGFYVGLYLSTDPTIATTDRLVGSRWVPSLIAGASSIGSTTVTIPTTVTLGTYYIGAIADYTGLVAEVNEANNALAGNTIVVTAPTNVDLIPTAVSGPTSGATGATITIADTVGNQGTSSAAGFYVGLYLSTDPTIATTDRLLGTRYVSSLAAGASSSGSTTVTIPAVESGTYYIGAIADYNAQIGESNETNNARLGNGIAMTVSQADLVMTAVSGPPTGILGRTITISNTVVNQGLGSTVEGSLVGLYLSTDATITTADILIGTQEVGNLAPGTSSAGNTVVELKTTIPPGTYYLGAIADYNGRIAETNEANNVRIGNSITITP